MIKSDNVLIGTDLVLTSLNRIENLPITPDELAGEIDYSFITHEHGDHFERGTSRILREKGTCRFIMPKSCLRAAHEEMNIPDERIIVAEPRKPFNIDNILIEPIRAIHGNSKYAVYYDANLDDCGYLITIGGKRILQQVPFQNPHDLINNIRIRLGSFKNRVGTLDGKGTENR